MPKNPRDEGTSVPQQEKPGELRQAAPDQSAMPGDAAAFAMLIRQALAEQGFPVTFMQARLPHLNTTLALHAKPRTTVAFPPCAGELLALISHTDQDDVSVLFNEYFKFAKHRTLGQDGNLQELANKLGDELDDDLLTCAPTGLGSLTHGGVTGAGAWPSDCCLCAPCVTLDGDRRRPPAPLPPANLTKLFIGDALWLFYFDRMGIQQILGAILDSYAYNGRLPISNGSIDRSSVRDDIAALVMEVMVRQTKTGMSSSVRDRGALYRTSLGWSLPTDRQLGLDTQVNSGLSALFHRLVYYLLQFYKDRRLAFAIQGTAGTGTPMSGSTLVAIGETLDVLRKRFEPFNYGRNYYNTLSGIVWTIAGMSLIRELRGTLGIPPAFEAAHEYIPAAYELLVAKRPITQGEANRYLLHADCARSGRNILLDVEVVDSRDTTPTGEVARFADQIEPEVITYQNAYRTLTGIDLSTSATPAVEQQV